MKKLKQYMLAFSAPHHQFLTLLKICNYMLNSPLYSQNNKHISALYQHMLLDSDPFYIMTLYNPIVYTFDSFDASPEELNYPLKRESLLQLKGVAVVFVSFGRVFVLTDTDDIYSGNNQVGILVQKLKYNPQFPQILNEIVVPRNDNDVVGYGMLDSNEGNSLSIFISELNRLYTTN